MGYGGGGFEPPKSPPENAHNVFYYIICYIFKFKEKSIEF